VTAGIYLSNGWPQRLMYRDPFSLRRADRERIPAEQRLLAEQFELSTRETWGLWAENTGREPQRIRSITYALKERIA
jgi:hypothetical protein